jgi:hypothetical protein
MITMKKTKLFLALFVLSMSLVSIVSAASVEPVLWEDWKSGNAWNECSQLPCCEADYAYKIDGWGSSGMDGVYYDYPVTITISSSDGQTFDWTSDKEVCAVIVKGGKGANVYCYDPPAFGDTGLVGPLNLKSPAEGDTHDISHVTFCIDIPDFKIPETPIGTISSVLAMVGAALLLRSRNLSIK